LKRPYLVQNYKTKKWYLDSGASDHYINDLELLTNIKKNKKTIKVTSSKRNQDITIEAIGDLKLYTDEGEALHLQNVKYMPDVTHNLLSVGRITNGGYEVSFTRNEAIISYGTRTIVRGIKLENNLYELSVKELQSQPQHEGRVESANLNLWHARMGHINIEDVKKLQKLVRGIEIKEESKRYHCEACIQSQLKQATFDGSSKKNIKGINELIHTDVCGPMPIEAIGGYRYFIIFVDEYSHVVTTYLMHKKEEANRIIKRHITFVENQQNAKVKTLRHDRGGEYESKDVTEWPCEERNQVGQNNKRNSATKWNR
jgi:hypothetical protein